MKRDQIRSWCQKFYDEYGFKAIIGCELEFYVSDEKIINIIKETSELNSFELTSEKGEKQFELRFWHSDKVVDLLDHIEEIKRIIISTANKNKAQVYFHAKPFSDQPGSAFHVHLNFLDKDGKNVFCKAKEQESPYLLYSVGGLLATMEESMKFFAPTPDSFKRFITSMETPTTISWGGNNRTTAIRIPPSYFSARRIEHRVSGADANIYEVVDAILQGVAYGLQSKILPPQKTYGNAFDEQYSLKKLYSTTTPG